jgi:hypothetical protein
MQKGPLRHSHMWTLQQKAEQRAQHRKEKEAKSLGKHREKKEEKMEMKHQVERLRLWPTE